MPSACLTGSSEVDYSLLYGLELLQISGSSLDLPGIGMTLLPPDLVDPLSTTKGIVGSGPR